MDLVLEQLKRPVSDTDPSGENQEYDSLYLSLEELAVGVPASQMGDSVIEGKEPDWRLLQKNCLELWERTRDLRVAAYLAVAGLALHGLNGFADGLELIRWLFSEQWDSFWPRLDPDDDNDPLERLNIISMISPPPGAYDDPLHFLALFRNQRLVPEGVSYTLRDLMIAEGELDSDEKRLDLNLLNAEMSAVPVSMMIERGQLVERIQELLAEISRLFESHTEQYALSFVLLSNELKRLKRFYDQFGLVQEAPAGASEEVQETAPQQTAVRPGITDLASVRARNRAEALLLLRKGCEYFQTAEPTSPVPFLINRALRMAEMNFMDLLAEIDANAVERGRDILGVRHTENESE